MAFLFRVLCCLLLPILAQGQAGASSDDGFVRRNGTMHVLRHGQLRPLTREIHLPNGRTVTPDGFVLDPAGGRTELAEGQGCTLLGQPTAVQPQPNGQWALRPAMPAPAPATAVGATPARISWLPPGWRKKWHGKKKGRKH
ncbi:hypothetical protein F0P96_09670 [Hymenobacter busanensis]|uniref:Uncharacterized protein n=1 Tax=Hymenobacter busanensis TaxID=2607656 RepID=A0A7L4ZYH3_9BACT|nr:DUF6799 domain-containing protein [Hymenobacter busanensis]KAA9333236.1 hypothetical protein F0P96_09670 [Hymenobacter busanensis]QHJ08087.1 hypothetical protein GUY19_12650 [Hymenobacter busanensis]